MGAAELNTTPHVIVSLVALGMGLAFIVADRESPTSRALALTLALVGISIATNVLLIFSRYLDDVPAWSGLFAIPEMLSFVFGYEWLLRVRRTIPSGRLDTRWADLMLRVSQLLATVYGVLSILLPQWRAEFFVGAFVSPQVMTDARFYLFALPLELSLTLAAISGLVLLNRKPDMPEKLRLLAFLSAAPLLASGLVLPLEIAPVTTALGLIVLLVGAVQYHVIQGQRAQFLSRFLSPQVAQLVREQGMESATSEKSVELSVVCCDLRGFTAMSAQTASQTVIAILRQYYDCVGKAVAEYGGTIKDQAGDGILILMGAPLSITDHADRSLELAQALRDRVMALSNEWRARGMNLGMGIGVSSGFVTVGVIGAASRLEYTAVGQPVNLAARLCSEAAAGEVLVDQRTQQLTASQPNTQLQPAGDLQLKGFTHPVPSFVLAV